MSRRRQVIGAGLGVGVVMAILPALAQEAATGGLQMRFGVDQRLEVNDNLELDPVSAGTTTTATTRLSFGLVAATPVDSFTLDASTALRASEGPDGSETFFDDQRLGFGYTRDGANSRFSFDGSYRRTRIDYLRPLEEFLQDGVIVLPEDLDDLNGDGTRVSYALGTKLEFGLNAPLGLVFDARASGLDYEDVTDPDLVQARRLSYGVQARLALSPVMTGTLTARQALYEADDIEATERTTDTVEVGLDYTVSPVLQASAGVGYTVLDIEEFGITDRVEGTTLRLGFTLDRPNGQLTGKLDSRASDDGIRQTLSLGRSLVLPNGALSAEIGMTGIDWSDFEPTAALTWRQNLPSGSVSAALRRTVIVNNDDQDELVTALTLGYGHTINAVSGIDLALTYAVSDDGTSDTDRASFTATYRHALTQDWTLDAGYRHRVLDDAGGRASSNSVFVGLGRSFDFTR